MLFKCVTDEPSRRRLVSWLEDQVIRHLPIEERTGLRDVDSSNFIQFVQEYLISIECPYKWIEKEEIICLDWLINFALRLQYEDRKVEKNEHETSSSSVDGVNDHIVSPSDDHIPLSTFSSLDWSSYDVTQAVDKLAQSLNIACHPDRKVTLEAVLRLIVKKKQCQSMSKKQEVKLMKGPGYSLNTAKLTTKSGESNELATAEKVLRLVHLNQLRSLQNVVNDLIVLAQAITAEPKTDASLAT